VTVLDLTLNGPASVLDLAFWTLAFAALVAACPRDVLPSAATTSAASASPIANRSLISADQRRSATCRDQRQK
jgi:hypothetical protein